MSATARPDELKRGMIFLPSCVYKQNLAFYSSIIYPLRLFVPLNYNRRFFSSFTAILPGSAYQRRHMILLHIDDPILQITEIKKEKISCLRTPRPPCWKQ